MAEGSSKSLKITAAIDSASFDKARNAISALTREVNKLIEATNKINLGGGLGMKMSSTAAQSGGPSSISQMSGKFGTGSGSGGIANTLTQAVSQAATLFKTSATGSTAAFKIMQDNLRQMVTNSGREINTLTVSLQKLESTYAKLQARAASGRGGALTNAALGQAQEQRAAGMGAFQSAQAQFQHARALQIAAGNPNGGPGGGGGIPPGIVPPGGRGGGGKAAGGGLGASFGGIGTLLGGAGLGFLGAGTVLAGAIGAANFGLSSAYENRGANLQYGIGLQTQVLNRQATYGDIYGGNAVALSHGNIALSHAMREAAKDREYSRATANVGVAAQRQLINLQNPTGLGGAMLRGGVGGIGTIAKSGLGNYINSYGNGPRNISAPGADVVWRNPATGMEETHRAGWQPPGSSVAGSNGLGGDFSGRTTLDIANTTAQQKLPEQIAQERQAALQAVMARNPLLNSRMQEYYSGAMGDISLARTAHIGGGLVRDPRTASFSNPMGSFTSDAVANFKAAAQSRGYDAGSVAGMMQQMNASMGMGRGGAGGAMGMLGKQAAGFHSALSVSAMGGQFGAAGLAGAISGRGGLIGTGGLNISAGSNIFGLGAGMMGSGNFAGNPGALMEAMASAGFTGNIGGDMRQSRIMEAGVGAMRNMMGGGIDPLQRGLNASAALKAAPSGSYGVHAALMSLDPGTMMAAMKSNSVPPELAKQGVTLDILKKYVSAQQGTMFARYASSMGTGTEVGAAISRYQKAGGTMDYMKGWSLSRKRNEINSLGLGAKLAGIAPSMEAGESMFALQAGTAGVLKRPRGAGAFAVGATGPRAAALRAGGELTRMGGVGIAKNSETTAGAASALPGAVESSEGQRQDAQIGASLNRGEGGVEGAIQGLDQAFRTFVATLRGDSQILGNKMGGIKKAMAPGAR